MESDHNPILINLLPTTRKKPRYFLFEFFWINLSDFPTIVSTSWASQQQHHDSSDFMNKINRTKRALNSWQHRAFGGLSTKIQSLKSQLLNAQAMTPSDHTLRT